MTTPVFQPPFYDHLVTDVVWQGSPIQSPIIADIYVFNGKPSSPFYAPRGDIQPSWQWVPQNVTIVEPPASQNPFSRLWRYDLSYDAFWSGAPAQSPIISDLTSGGEPFSRLWRYDLSAPEYMFQGPRPRNRFLSVGQSKTKTWRHDLVPDVVWQGSPIKSPIIADFTSGGTPFSRLWRWDVSEPQNWQWSPPNGTINQPPVGTPFSRLWRYDLSEQTSWQWGPPNGTINQPPVGTPFYRLWRYDLVPDPVWQGSPFQSIVEPLASQNPFSRLWRYDLSYDAFWSGAPAHSPIISDLTSGGKPFSRLWRYDLSEQTNWQWNPPKVSAPSSSPFFRRLWRWDVADPQGWQWNPPKVRAPSSSPFFRRLWRWDVADPQGWQWTPPKVTSPAVAATPFHRLWRYDVSETSGWSWAPPVGVTKPSITPVYPFSLFHVEHPNWIGIPTPPSPTIYIPAQFIPPIIVHPTPKPFWILLAPRPIRKLEVS